MISGHNELIIGVDKQELFRHGSAEPVVLRPIIEKQ